MYPPHGYLTGQLTSSFPHIGLWRGFRCLLGISPPASPPPATHNTLTATPQQHHRKHRKINMITTYTNFWNKHKDITTGRASRRDTWMSLGLILLLGLLTGVVAILLALIHPSLGILVSIPWVVFTVWMSLTVCVKRLRDLGFSGWHYLTLTVITWAITAFEDSMGIPLEEFGALSGAWAIINLVIFYVLRGTVGDNVYGADPVEEKQ